MHGAIVKKLMVRSRRRRIGGRRRRRSLVVPRPGADYVAPGKKWNRQKSKQRLIMEQNIINDKIIATNVYV
jgi:hypothetical protein